MSKSSIMESITYDLNVDVKKIDSESDSDDDTPLQLRINNLQPKGCNISNKRLKISQGLSFPELSIQVKVERADDNMMSSGSQFAVVALEKVKTEIDDDSGTDELDHIPLSERRRMLISRQSMETVSHQHDAGNMEGVYVETSFAPLVNVKVETLENGLASPHRNEPGISLVDKMLGIKTEMGISWISDEDELDHMSLRERLRLLTAKKVSDTEDSGPSECSQKSVPSVEKCKPTSSENAKSEVKTRPRKRKKTATNCAETALEEDAPGLLKVLVDKGILLDEIKLYGGIESEDALDSSFDENSFEDLQFVISKLFAQRETLFKFAPLQGGKGSKAANYCLSCLISLVEQARYLQFMKWPVEWGWCRDLQSFIFVFERHNRIVLERPEYGYATYFFELVNALPVEWQIKRLVGKDLSEGEARVLEEYGWIPDSGLGSMLNYCDRVVHDKSNERDGSEWRNKIGKLLMNGLKGGNIVLSNLPKKLMGDKSTTSNSQIKLEL
ncbi:hypothetical protein C5167_005351 [Papaver somniferum]|uniref:Uncharacterized protein n=1 Tax=Papaver somniferum TaxID=3469 RepID=A0A4Y7JDC5_PAPSO|nr:hypothetical protein C5167_005351 [Papaver somniferum]